MAGLLPKRQCMHPGCGKTAAERSSKCIDHQRAKYKASDAVRPNADARGYDALHRRLRILCFQRDGWRCRTCGWEPLVAEDFRRFDLGPPPTDQVVAELKDRFKQGERHLHADHIIPITQRPDLRSDLENYQTLCSTCHNAKTMRESGPNAAGTDVNHG